MPRYEVEPYDASVWQAFFQRGQNLREGLLKHQHLYRGVRQDEQLFGHCEPPVQRHQHGAEARAGVEQYEIVGPVQAEDRNPVATADAEFGLQRTCRMFDAPTERRVTQHLSFKYNRGFVRRECRIAFDEVGKVHFELVVRFAGLV